MNTANQNQTATETETSRLWHELTESQARETALAKAGYNLVSALEYDFEEDLPRRSRRMLDKLVSELPQHFRDQLKRVYGDGEGDDRMSKLNKYMLVGTLSLMAGLLVWAYVHTLVA